MNIGDTVYVLGVKTVGTNIKEGIFAGLRLPVEAVFGGKVVEIRENTVLVDIPTGHNTPWEKHKDEVHEREEDAIEALKLRLKEMRRFLFGAEA